MAEEHNPLNSPSIRLIKEAGWFVHYAAGLIVIHVRGYQRIPGNPSIAEAMKTRLYPAQLTVARVFLKDLLDMANRPIPEIEVQAKDTTAKLDAAETVHAQITLRTLLAQFTREELYLLRVPGCYQSDPSLKIEI